MMNPHVITESIVTFGKSVEDISSSALLTFAALAWAVSKAREEWAELVLSWHEQGEKIRRAKEAKNAQ